MTSARTVLSGLAMGVGLGAFVACMSNHGLPPTKTSLGPEQKRFELVTELIDLSGRIQTYRKEIGLPPNPMHLDHAAIEIHKTADGRHVCPDGHVAPQTCNDVCTTSDYICDNRDRICKIARELGDDDVFAREKCKSANASCTESQQKCCDCTAASDTSGDPSVP